MIQAIKLGMKPMIYTSEHSSVKYWVDKFDDQYFYNSIKRKKPVVYSASLDNPIFKDNDVILFYDTYDVLFFGDESHFKSSLHQISAQQNKYVFIGGGLNSWPFQDKDYNCTKFLFIFKNFLFIYLFYFILLQSFFFFFYFKIGSYYKNNTNVLELLSKYQPKGVSPYVSSGLIIGTKEFLKYFYSTYLFYQSINTDENWCREDQLITS